MPDRERGHWQRGRGGWRPAGQRRHDREAVYGRGERWWDGAVCHGRHQEAVERMYDTFWGRFATSNRAEGTSSTTDTLVREILQDWACAFGHGAQVHMDVIETQYYSRHIQQLEMLHNCVQIPSRVGKLVVAMAQRRKIRSDTNRLSIFGTCRNLDTIKAQILAHFYHRFWTTTFFSRFDR